MTGRINRRDFIKKSAATGAITGITFGGSSRAAVLTDLYDRQNSPNERLTLGFIGVGARAHQVLSEVLRMPGFEVA
ncbi:MAG: twin-arginine translocation signal domain-containing protein [Acidobacteria bacterium]|nr:twin-arginine translocation signal domain-containing protein [Acidobacteriota bacterium]